MPTELTSEAKDTIRKFIINFVALPGSVLAVMLFVLGYLVRDVAESRAIAEAQTAYNTAFSEASSRFYELTTRAVDAKVKAEVALQAVQETHIKLNSVLKESEELRDRISVNKQLSASLEDQEELAALVADNLLRSEDLSSLVSTMSGVLQVRHVQNNEFISSDNVIPYGDSRPLASQGVEVLQLSITPKGKSGRLLIEGLVYAVERQNNGDNLTASLFRDGEEQAFAAASNYIGIHESQYSGMRPVFVRHQISHGGIPTIIYLRVGMNRGRYDINGGTGRRVLGGSVNATLTVFELPD